MCTQLYKKKLKSKHKSIKIQLTFREQLSYFVSFLSPNYRYVRHIIDEGMARISNELDILTLLKDLRNLKLFAKYEHMEKQKFTIDETQFECDKNPV